MAKGMLNQVIDALSGKTQTVKGTNGAVGTFTVDSQSEGVSFDDPNAVITDVADPVTVVEKGQGKTVQEYLNDAVRKGRSSEIDYVNAKANTILSSRSQAAAVQTASLVAYRGLERDGVDQINPTVNPVLIKNVLGRFDLPSMVSVQPIYVTFNAGGGCYVNGEQVKPDAYDPAVLSKSLVLGGLHQSGISWPIFGFDIAVRAFSTEVGDAKLDISCFDTSTVVAESALDENAVLMYRHSYHLTDINKVGKLVCSLAVGSKVLTSGALQMSLDSGHHIFFNSVENKLRERDCFAALSIDSPTDAMMNSVVSINGVNVMLTITPLIVSKESVARVINNLDKDVAGYIGALANLRNANQDKFVY